MRKFQSMNPSDARIFVNFKNKKNPVRFDYPDKSSAFHLVWLTIFQIIAMILMFALIINMPIIIILSWNNLIDTTGILFYLCGCVVFFIFILPLILALFLVHNEKFLAQIPKIYTAQSLFFSRCYHSVLVKNLKKRVYELPVFENLFLEFIPRGDYGKYLEKIEVTEHEFCYVEVGAFSKKKKRVGQTEYWKARFYFSKVPKKGEMEINFL